MSLGHLNAMNSTHSLTVGCIVGVQETLSEMGLSLCRRWQQGEKSSVLQWSVSFLYGDLCPMVQPWSHCCWH